MEYFYILKTDVVKDKENKYVLTYGIEVKNTENIIIESYPELFFSSDEAVRFVDFCNGSKFTLDMLHKCIEKMETLNR